jgi:hypothetical protein
VASMMSGADRAHQDRVQNSRLGHEQQALNGPVRAEDYRWVGVRNHEYSPDIVYAQSPILDP